MQSPKDKGGSSAFIFRADFLPYAPLGLVFLRMLHEFLYL